MKMNDELQVEELLNKLDKLSEQELSSLTYNIYDDEGIVDSFVYYEQGSYVKIYLMLKGGTPSIGVDTLGADAVWDIGVIFGVTGGITDKVRSAILTDVENNLQKLKDTLGKKYTLRVSMQGYELYRN